MRKFKLKDETYDRLKWWAMYGLPTLGTFIFALGTIWNIPYVEQIVGTITAADTALAGMLGLSKKNYQEDDADA